MDSLKGEDVKEIRNDLGLSQTEFSVEFGVSLRTVQNWESSDDINFKKSKFIRNKYEELKNTESSPDREQYLKDTIENKTIEVLDLIGKEKIIGYLLLKEKEFQQMDSFKSFVEKQKTSERLRKIAKNG